MNRNEVTVAVFDLISKSLMRNNDIQLEDRLKEDLNMDSIGFVELGTGLEDNFNIDIPDDTLEQLVTVNQVVDVVMNSPTYAAE